MKNITAFAILSLAILSDSAAHAVIATAPTVTFSWAAVGNPGNTADPATGFGAVDHTYRISKHTVTNSQYSIFLNAIAASDPNGLYSSFMDSDTRGGIVRSGIEGNYTYAVKPDALGQGPGGSDYEYDNKPIVHVTYFDAIRFVNWLENGQPTGDQDERTTERGAYAFINGVFTGDGPNANRDPQATYFIPSENEWYKAAYHKNDGETGNYWLYPTSTNLVPNNNLPTADTGNSANFIDGFFTTGSGLYPFTDVGAYIQTKSPYGTFDQAGNVFEWNEGRPLTPRRGARGGDAADRASSFTSTHQRLIAMNSEGIGLGFRVINITIPEPSTLLLGGFWSLGMLFWHARLLQR